MGEFETHYSVVSRILLVEDDETERRELKDGLVAAGFEVETAKDGGQAHAAFSMHKPDFVLLDLILPNESGFEVCERMKQEDEAVPVLIYTAIKLDDSRNLAERMGADGYLVKPTPVEDLVEEIRRVAEQVWRSSHLTDEAKPTGERIRFTCPSCKVTMKVRAAHRGRQLSCPKCGHRSQVPRS